MTQLPAPIPRSALPSEGTKSGRRRFRRAELKTRLRIYLHPLVKPTHPTETGFVILSQVRSGSHLLRSLIECHPEIAVFRELLRIKTRYPKRLIQNALSARREPFVGFMVKAGHICSNQGLDLDEWLDWMHAGGFQMVYLRRRSLRLQTLSLYLAVSRTFWMQRVPPAGKMESLTVNLDEFRICADFLLSRRPVEERWLEALPGIRLTYEDDLLDPNSHQQTGNAVFQMLGLEPAPVKTDLLRITTDDPRDFVENWDEVAAIPLPDTSGE